MNEDEEKYPYRGCAGEAIVAIIVIAGCAILGIMLWAMVPV